MKSITRQSVIRYNELLHQIRLLTNLRADGKPVISCYLDKTQSNDQLEAFVYDRLSSHAEESAYENQFSVDFAVRNVISQLRSTLPPRIKGLSIFIGGRTLEPLIASMPFAVPFENSLSVSHVPDILPLLKLKETCGRFMIVLARTKEQEIAMVDLGDPSLKAWIANRNLRSEGSSQTVHRITTRVSTSLSKQVELIERLLNRGRSCPLFMAGDVSVMQNLANRLAPSSLQRLMGALPTTGDTQLQDTASQCLEIFIEERARSDLELSRQLLHNGPLHEQTVTGINASIEALKSGFAERLLIGSGYRPIHGWIFNADATPHPESLHYSSDESIEAMNRRIEAIRLAGQHEISIGFTEDEELQRSEGLACLVRDHPDQSALKNPQINQTSNFAA